MTIFLNTWDWHPSVVLGCIVLLVAYGGLVEFRPTRQAVWFGLGVLALLLALVSPLDSLGDTYLFSAHMLQHLVLVLLVPPLLLVGLPAEPVRQLLKQQAWLGRVERIVGQPPLSWLLGIGLMWVWHVPALYEAALSSETVHIVEHLSFLVTAVMLWWPALSPLEERRIKPVFGMLYLFGAALLSSLLGIMLTFAPPGLYPAYQNPVDRLGVLAELRGGWGLTPALDQQIGGLLMWVLGGVGYLLGTLVVLGRMFTESFGFEDGEDTGSTDLPKEVYAG